MFFVVSTYFSFNFFYEAPGKEENRDLRPLEIAVEVNERFELSGGEEEQKKHEFSGNCASQAFLKLDRLSDGRDQSPCHF